MNILFNLIVVVVFDNIGLRWVYVIINGNIWIMYDGVIGQIFNDGIIFIGKIYNGWIQSKVFFVIVVYDMEINVWWFVVIFWCNDVWFVVVFDLCLKIKIMFMVRKLI